MVRIRTEKPHAEAQKIGVPLKWVYRWHEKGTIVGPVEGHPDQYLVRKSTTGRVIKRSGRTLSKVPGHDLELDENPHDVGFIQEHENAPCF